MRSAEPSHRAVGRDAAAEIARDRELAYYRQGFDELGARVLRLQEEQSQAFREARRSRTVARLVRETYRLADLTSRTEEIGGRLLQTVIENTMCNRAALLVEPVAGSGVFVLEHVLGEGREQQGRSLRLAGAPRFAFASGVSSTGADACGIGRILETPYYVWSYDPFARHALVLGNFSEGGISRPFEAADRELVEGVLSVYVDVLARKRAEIELSAAKAAAEEAIAARSRFMAVLSHELRTPLTLVIGFSELLLSDAPSAAERHEYANHILDSGRQLLSLINDILDYSSISHATPTLRLERLPIQTIVNATAASFRVGAAQRQITIELDGQAAELEIPLDHTRLRQVLNNILGNAVKFTPNGGTIAVAVYPMADGGVEIRVRDSGIGMKPDDIPRALEPFVQLDARRGRRFPGTGLGLPIAKSLVEAHRGSFWLESEPGRGTTVIVRLPGAATSLLTSQPDETGPTGARSARPG